MIIIIQYYFLINKSHLWPTFARDPIRLSALISNLASWICKEGIMSVIIYLYQCLIYHQLVINLLIIQLPFLACHYFVEANVLLFRKYVKSLINVTR